MFVINILYQVFFITTQQQGADDKELAKNTGHKLYQENADLQAKDPAANLENESLDVQSLDTDGSQDAGVDHLAEPNSPTQQEGDSTLVHVKYCVG